MTGHPVASSWPARHPFYSDDNLTAAVTDWLLEQDRTIFQLFLLSPYESLHSLDVLCRVNVPWRGRVISLGCGVGGMERYWKVRRPDVDFTLVNASQSQLDRCLCDGNRVHADMQDAAALPAPGTYDLAVLAYSLHHCDDVQAMLDVARGCLKPGGVVLVLDVIDGSQHFTDMMRYRSLDSAELQRAGLRRIDHTAQWHRVPEAVLSKPVCSMLDADSVAPSMWIGT